ncbi:MAG: hypothetical protein ACK5KQ_01465 [Anaerorhabdus sp.]
MKYLKLWFEDDDKVKQIGRQSDRYVIESISIRNKEWTRNSDMERKLINDSDLEFISEERAKVIIERILNS